MKNQLDLAFFDHREHDEMVEFIVELTAEQSMHITYGDEGSDSYVLVFCCFYLFLAMIL